MPIVFQKIITRENIRDNREIIYVFGDNDMRFGYGGQAKNMRGELNSVGVRTKKRPFTGKDVYYMDYEYNINTKKIDEDFAIIEKYLKEGTTVIIPEDGLGTGLALLEKNAPKTLEYIKMKIKDLKETYK